MPIDYGTNSVSTSGNVSVSGVVTATSGVFTNLTIGSSSFNNAVSGLLPSISNSGDNRILTSTGSSVGINAESNLTFDGSTVLLSGTLRLGDTAGNRVQFYKGGGSIYDYSIGKEGNHLAISTASDGSTNRYSQFGYHNGSTWTPKTVVNNYNGNIGIGTTTPVYQLDVVGSGHLTQNLLIDGDCAVGATKAYKFNGNAWGYDKIIFRSDVNNKITVDSSGNYNWLVAGKNWTLSDVGNVGIGTITPEQKLTIAGDALFQNINSKFYWRNDSSRVVGIENEQSSPNSDLNLFARGIGSGWKGNIKFYTSNNSATITERMRIDSDGKVGIGTSSPAADFHVNKTESFFGTNTNGYVQITDDVLGDELGLSISTSTVTDAILATYNTDGTFRYGGQLNSEFIVISSGGNVGIGTSSPNARLHSYSATSGDTVFNVEGTNGSLFSVVDNLSGTLMSVNNNAGLPVFEVFSDDKIVGGRFGQNDFVITSSGNIGLGTSAPSGKLDVEGDIYASGMYVDSITPVSSTGNLSGSWTLNNVSIRNKTLATFTSLDNQPPASNFATLDTRNSIAVLDFSDTTEESAVFVGVIPEGAALASGIDVRILWAATSATTGNCRWGVQFEKMTTDLDSDSFDTATEAHSATNGTNGIATTTSITCTNIDSLSAGDFFRMKIYRDASDTTNDTMTGDAELIALELRSVL